MTALQDHGEYIIDRMPLFVAGVVRLSLQKTWGGGVR